MKYCPYCGAPVQTSDAKFCSECGREFAPVEHEQAKQKKKRLIPLFFVKKGTNLIHASVDPKTVQYLAGHEKSKITMDIYAKVKYNRPEQLLAAVNRAFGTGMAVS